MIYVGFMLLVMASETGTSVNLSDYDIFAPNIRITVNDENILAVLKDDSEKVLLLFNGHKGTLIAKCGRKGAGPEEFGSPDAVWWSPQSATFCVFDADHGRVSQWDSLGNFSGVTKVDQKLKDPFMRRDGRILFTRNRYGLLSTRPTLQQVAGLNGPRRVLWSAPADWFQAARVKIDGQVMVVSKAWDPRLLYAVGEDFVAVAYTINNRVEILDSEGQPQHAFMVDFKQYAVTDQDISEQMARFFPMLREKLQAKRETLFKHQFWPEVHSLLVDNQDRIWLIGQPERTEAALTPIKLFNDKGEVLQAFKLSSPPRALSQDTMFLVEAIADNLYLKRRPLPK